MTRDSGYTYDVNPSYLIDHGVINSGYDTLAEAASKGRRIAIDGPPTPDWDLFATRLVEAFKRREETIELYDTRDLFPCWEQLLDATSSSVIDGDPHLARLYDGQVSDLLSSFPAAFTQSESPAILYGPGASTAVADEVWYLDTPRRYALNRVNEQGSVLGRVSDQQPDFRRMVFCDWPAIEATRRSLIDQVSRFIDLSSPRTPTHLDGPMLRRSLATLAERPFRTAPHFLAGAWGGKWMQNHWSLHADYPNLAWSYELIAPEAGVVFSDVLGRSLEIPLDLVVAANPELILGPNVHKQYGFSFPIRFDYLDTYQGSPLSLHCHPQAEYMQDVFGWPYTQHESYYVMATLPGSKIFLGLLDDTDLGALRRACDSAAEQQVSFNPADHINSFDAEKHGLYLIPAGTPHASGSGNLVLEISSTPYFYSLRLYDWLRVDLDGNQRDLHINHAFQNIVDGRRGEEVSQLRCEPSLIRELVGAAEYELANDDIVPFGVNRLEFDDSITDATRGRFHILNLVEGRTVEIRVDGVEPHRLNYGETILIPAAVEDYSIHVCDGGPAKVVKAFIR